MVEIVDCRRRLLTDLVQERASYTFVGSAASDRTISLNIFPRCS